MRITLTVFLFLFQNLGFSQFDLEWSFGKDWVSRNQIKSITIGDSLFDYLHSRYTYNQEGQLIKKEYYHQKSTGKFYYTHELEPEDSLISIWCEEVLLFDQVKNHCVEFLPAFPIDTICERDLITASNDKQGRVIRIQAEEKEKKESSPYIFGSKCSEGCIGPSRLEIKYRRKKTKSIQMWTISPEIRITDELVARYKLNGDLKMVITINNFSGGIKTYYYKKGILIRQESTGYKNNTQLESHIKNDLITHRVYTDQYGSERIFFKYEFH